MIAPGATKRIAWIAVATTTLWLGVALAAADAIDDEYGQRAKALRADDIDGHLDLARWCREKRRWQLMADQCRLVLRLRTDHAEGGLLLELARANMDKSPAKRTPGRKTRPIAGGDLPLLDDEQVQRIRRVELHLDGRERVNLKIERSALDEFVEWAAKRGGPLFDRRAFLRQSRREQALEILERGREEFGERITVLGDPERLRAFEREILPVVLPGCATSECHGGNRGGEFRIHGGRSLRTHAVYANFFLMHEYERDDRRLIDRNQPKRSLLLVYGLPADPEAKRLEHPTPIRRVFRDEDDDRYRTVLDWLRSLDIQRPDYGIDLSAP